MGITIQEMIESEYFQDFKVIAGHRGLDKQIQGIAIFDAPDGFEWVKGRELVISSGYVFQQNPEAFKRFIHSENIKRISGFGIKVDRFLKKIPEYVVKLLEEYGVPLLVIPVEPSWMDIINQLNVLVMNKSIERFGIRNINPKNYSNVTYQSRKINKILSQIEKEMTFPAMLYDVTNEKAYYSSSAFTELAGELKLGDFWRPSFDFTQEILCDNLKMLRYRFIDEKYDRPYSWITIPITVGDRIKAYFVVIEATELIDYFDQFALRIGFLLLQSLYEQTLVAQSIEDKGFEKFVLDIIYENLSDNDIINNRAVDLGLNINASYYLVLMKQINEKIHLLSYKDELKSSVTNRIRNIDGRMTLIDDNTCVFIFPIDDNASDNQNVEIIKDVLKDLQNRLQKKIIDIDLLFGISNIRHSITEVKRNYLRADQTIKIGRLVYPNEDYLTYSQLGVFAWMDIKEDELEIMSKDIELLIKSDQNNVLIETLRTYLECKMNYSLAAKHLFVHINTVRKRIEDINDLISFDLDEPINRLKLELLLKLIK